MRTWGKQYSEDGTYQWVEVATDANGYNDSVYLTTLVQALKLNLGESPFFADLGIPQYQTVVTQVLPTFYVNQIQQYFAPYFASLTITQVPAVLPPQYNVNVVCHSGAIINETIAV
jgi:hypothetical protein